MSCTPKNLQAFDVGTELVLRIIDDAGVVVNLAAASELLVLLGRPDGNTFDRVANLVTDGSDGLMRYTTVGGDIDGAGVWKIQGLVAFPSVPGKFRSEVLTFRVERNIDGASLICPAPLGIVLDLPAITVV